MAEPISVTVKVTQLAKNAYEIRAIMKGRFYKRQYIGYSKKKALARFEQWLGEQL